MKDTFGYSYLNKNDLPNQIQQVVLNFIRRVF